ncbi:MAG: uracil-DNA glycosylase [Deltaproteobacteria bacterium]|nr:uracil-DNA glycosylase [Deltaproteobacteria bacterium]
MQVALPPSWREALAAELDAEWFRALGRFVDAARAAGPVFPPERDVFAAFTATPLDAVRVVLLGQDPYHGAGQAHGLCFSVRPGIAPPPSLRNVYEELAADVPGFVRPRHGHLAAWARQGVLLLNAVLTVEADRAGSHARRGWERFTDTVLAAVNARRDHVVFLLWGNHARRKGALVDRARHTVIEAAHPSPLSYRAFAGSRPFSRANAALVAHGRAPIDWRLPVDAGAGAC